MSLQLALDHLVDGDRDDLVACQPETLGRYLIDAEIGRGSMGVVYRATDPLLGRRVALKVVRLPHAAGAPERALAEERFLREASLAARIEHPNTVIVHDFGRDAATDLPFIAFEYLEGRVLSELLANGARLPWREALRLTARLAAALHHAHALGVIHRDIKPSNVMLLESGEPKILDFGIARASTAALTSAGETWGTPAYMSPEQVTGMVLDARSDLFSLGSLCFELVTGRRAFSGANVPQIAAHIAFDQPPRPSSIDPSLSRGVDVLLARALAKNPAARYACGNDFAEDIADVLEDRPLRERAGLAVMDTARRPLPERTRPRRAWATPLFGAMGALLIVPLLPAALSNTTGPVPAMPMEASALAAVAVPTPSPAPKATPTRVAVPAPMGRVALSVEHRLEQGRLRVWVDDSLALERRLAGKPTRHLLVLKRRTGSLGEVLEIRPGQRSLRFEVVSEGVRRTGELSARFKSDETRLLRLKVGKRLDLEWQS